MCGIFAAFNLRENPELSLLKECIDIVSHRGPDNNESFIDKNCYLAHTRLSIIDLDSRSNQPFEYDNLIIVYNGEIFNYIEIRNILIKNNYSFETTSDTEVIIKAFHLWGKKCLEHFNGMWSIIIYNKKTGSLFVSRDRFGQKPLFYLKKNGTLYFASEIQQLTLIEKKPNYKVVQMFLKEGNYDSNNNTFFKNIFEFPKSHFLEVDNSGELYSQKYWDYPIAKSVKTNEEHIQKFNKILNNATKIRTRSDVEIGLLLSGGIDSTVIAGISNNYLDKKKKTIALNYSSEDSMDEKEYAAKVAEELGYNFFYCTQNEAPMDFIQRLRKIVKHLGRGHSSPAIIPIDYLYEYIASKNIKVVLDGQGADELLAGYQHFFVPMILEYLKKLNFKELYFLLIEMKKFGVLRAIILWARLVMPEYLKRIGRIIYGYEKFFDNYNHKLQVAPIKDKSALLKTDNFLNKHLVAQHKLGLDNLLYYGDIVAMKNSVENRSPFMDHRLVEYSFSKDHKLKIYRGKNKYVLKKHDAYLKFKEILERKKIGFSFNILPDTKDIMINQILESNFLDNEIFSKKIKSAFHKGIFKTIKYERILFRIFQVYLWNDIYFGNKNR